VAHHARLADAAHRAGNAVFMMFLYGYALDVNINDVEVMVEDPSPTPETAS